MSEAQAEAQPEPGTAGTDRTLETVEELPKELGVLLMTAGVIGLVLPGPIGTPLFLAGGLVLWPGTFRRLARWMERRHPQTHAISMRQLGRLVADLERRYPRSSAGRDHAADPRREGADRGGGDSPC